MNTNPENSDPLSLNFNAGGNSPTPNPIGYNGSPLAAFKMDTQIYNREALLDYCSSKGQISPQA